MRLRTGAFLAALVVATVGSTLTSAGGPGSGTARTGTVLVDGRLRSYRVFEPARLRTPVPVVVVLHGGFGNAEGTARQTGFDDQAARSGFLAVYPNGIGRAWNAGECCGLPARAGIDDVAFVVRLLDRLEVRYDVDEHRVYATGISNGGLLAYRLACERAPRFAAVAPVAATMVVACDPALPVSVLHVHGSADRNIPIAGGRGTKGVSRVDWPPVESALAAWRTTNRCSEPARVVTRGAVTRMAWSCPDRVDVELVEIAGGGHSWPGGERLSRILDSPSGALDATPEIWRFFAAHPRR